MEDHSGIFLDRSLIEDLLNAVAELERRTDNVIENARYRDCGCLAPSLEVREGVFRLLALVTNLEEDLSKSFRVFITEYLEQIYAFHAKLEEDTESLEDIARKTLEDDSVRRN